MRNNSVKHALNSGKVQIGTWITSLGTPQITQMLATAGFDFVYIDMEHSAFSIETVGDLCYAALAANLVPIVRPPGKLPYLLSRPLDAGAMGLLVPHVDTKEEAEAVIRATKFPPMGQRGMSLRGVHTGFDKAAGEAYVKSTNRETLLIVQIESRTGIENLEKILSVEGIDGAVIGRGDISTDLGIPGKTDHPDVLKQVEIMVEACRKKNKIPGLLVQDVASAKEWIRKGVRLLPFSNEVTMLIETASKAVKEIRGI